jgi:Fur family peroxide stress response transcriptional regulator
MKKAMGEERGAGLQQRLEKSGLRMTPQRQRVYELLVQKRDHPTAEEVFIRAKKGMPEISMATVYNCLDALVSCGLVRQVNQDRSATRLLEHAAA